MFHSQYVGEQTWKKARKLGLDQSTWIYNVLLVERLLFSKREIIQIRFIKQILLKSYLKAITLWPMCP